jgi:hypothetical protein
MKHIYTLTTILFFLTANLHAQDFINGSFENTTSSGCDYNLSNSNFNAKMPNVYAFGAGNEVDIKRSGCYLNTISDGDIAIAVATEDAVALELSSALIMGESYSITFDAHPNSLLPTINNLQVGCSLANDIAGDIVYTTNLSGMDTWSTVTINFVAPNNGTFITLSGSSTGWTDLDNFIFSSETLSMSTFDLAESIRVYPNPANNMVSINTEVKKVTITDVTGKQVMTTTQNKFNIVALNNGVYFVQVEDLNGNTTVKRLIKK